MKIKIENLPKHLKLTKKEIKKIIERKISALKDYFKKSGFKKGIIGISGGIDSSLCGVLATKALGKKNIYFVRMPYLGISSKESLKNVEILAKNLNLPEKNLITVEINKPVDLNWEILKNIKKGKEKIRKGNLMARERMMILFDLSSAFGAIVIGTENRTEKELGYFTLWGDQASGIEIIKDLWKSQVYQIASFFEEIPKTILKEVPSPDLWKNQTAEKELGFSYFEADIVLSALKDLNLKKEEISKRFKIPKKKVERILKQAKIGEIKNSLPFLIK